LQAQPFIDCDDPAVKRQAQYLAAETPLDTVRNIYQWVAEHLDYTGPSGKDRGALHALQTGQGDCTDAAYLVAALCRASGIAARCVGGYVCSQDKNLRAREFHNWAEFWADGRWQVADPVNRCFADRATTYIITRIWQVEDSGHTPEFFWRHRLEGTNLAVRMIG
jgi:transglutaminase-like putative cysteine protease